MENIKHSFCPIINADSKILILGSMPSKISREKSFYYANPTNRFWKILSSIFAVDLINATTEQKTEFLLENNIALYDVYAECDMKKDGSSLDSYISNPVLADIPNLVKNTKINKIFVTSKKAYGDFCKRYGEYFESLNIKITNLPSPSGANRSVYRTDEDLIVCWKKSIFG